MSAPSQPTSNTACARNPTAPFGLRRRGAICGVAAPRRWKRVAIVASPGISPRGARNAGHPISPTDS